MNNKIKLAVAGAVLSAASVANAGIVIPAGDWTLDVNGNVNAFAIWSGTDKVKNSSTVSGGLVAHDDLDSEDKAVGINTGLLPAWLGFTGTTRQNDVDVSFTISFQPNVSDNGSAGDAKTPLNRQAFITFGDKSWGSVKLGKDLGIFAGQAILHDMTLLGVGASVGGTTSGSSTTLGGIGTGYIYPAWKGQIAYTTPNMNGFQATLAITNPNGSDLATTGISSASTGSSAAELYQDRFGIEGQVSYDWTGDVAGKVWVSGASYDVTGATTTANQTARADVDSYTASAWDIGAAISAGNFGLTAYWYDGDGVGSTIFGRNGVYTAGTGNYKKRDSDGGYLQATYVIPTGTKLGVAYGVSNLDKASGESATASQGTANGATAYLLDRNERWTVGAYHPLTKHLNLVAEYNRIESEAHKAGVDYDSDSFSLGAILFF
jgi:predicted porin